MSGPALRIAVVAGGPSSEAAVSRRSAAAVAEALRGRGHGVEVLELDAGLPGRLASGDFDAVFPAVHGPLGEDGCLQGLLEVLGAKYTGSGVLASALAANKPQAKLVFRAAGLPVAEEILVGKDDDPGARAREIPGVLGPSIVVKPAGGGSAIGVARIDDSRDTAAVVAAIEQALAVDSRVLIERMSLGQEVTCGVLEDDCGRAQPLPPTWIVPRAADWYDFRSRYRPGGSEHQCPAPFPGPLNEAIQRIARRAHEALGARDLSRVDFVVDEAGGAVTLLEVNTLPGMTATSLFPEAAAVAGVPFDELCDGLVRRAIARPQRRVPEAVPMPDTPEG